MSLTDNVAGNEVSPALLVDAMFAYGKTAAIKAAIELDLFMAIGAEGRTAKALASEMGSAERGLRILCDFLVVSGFLTKTGDIYGLTPSSQLFLDRRSPAYMGAAINFVASSEMLSLVLDDPTACVRNGGAVGLGNISADNPVWVKFARAMGAFTGASARALASEVAAWPKPPAKVLDIAAGPGLFGIEVAKVAPSARIVALDWKPVLAVTEENATNAGVIDRFSFLQGSAFDLDWGSGYDLVLLPNFLHHFDVDGCGAILGKARASLAPGGRVAVVEFMPNEDRVSPGFPATFAWVMLTTTPRGDAYTERELSAMARAAGFSDIVSKPLPPTPASLLLFG
ncbi:class I SAM-dependent methyltransferase [Rhizobium sp. Root1220]|uniref:class I SAM-dependent methyltransferase n=1 Tax=Rhizobium sp. Root1220 TaxID=1736432 RepID=UPI0006F8392D|nr:class I SAM-dependent methyltransferase [Rhizobium sp. Root1220]KQV81333.1 SAM-dependent methyltransferase [Rhizobium sp. Root1220]